jgi:translation initiation factor 6
MIQMGVEKLRILGNDYVGAWVTATDKFFLLGNEVSRGEEQIIRENIGVDGIRVSIGGFGFVGIYAAANSNGVLVPGSAEEHELAALRQQLSGVNVEILHTDFNALKNNILANDKIAIINPEYNRLEEKRIADVLGVETMKMSIGGYSTVGANNILTNKGLVLNNKVSEHEKKKVEEMVHMQSEQSTANLGSVSIGLCVTANSNGIVAGRATTGFELARITSALNIE